MAQIGSAKQRRRTTGSTATTSTTSTADCSDEIDIDVVLDIITSSQQKQLYNNTGNHHGGNRKEELQRTFGLFDVDGTGTITKDNLKQIATELGENAAGAGARDGADDDMLQLMIDTFDRDLSGGINFEEFCRIMECK